MATEHELKAEGTVDQIKGKANQVAGVLTNDKGQKAKGEAEETEGKLKSKAGHVLQSAKKFVKDI